MSLLEAAILPCAQPLGSEAASSVATGAHESESSSHCGQGTLSISPGYPSSIGEVFCLECAPLVHRLPASPSSFKAQLKSASAEAFFDDSVWPPVSSHCAPCLRQVARSFKGREQRCTQSRGSSEGNCKPAQQGPRGTASSVLSALQQRTASQQLQEPTAAMLTLVSLPGVPHPAPPQGPPVRALRPQGHPFPVAWPTGSWKHAERENQGSGWSGSLCRMKSRRACVRQEAGGGRPQAASGAISHVEALEGVGSGWTTVSETPCEGGLQPQL